MPQTLTPEIIQAAIAGFEAQKSQIDSQITELRSMLDGRSTTQPTAPTETAKPRKKRSAAVRKKMALAQERDSTNSGKTPSRRKLPPQKPRRSGE